VKREFETSNAKFIFSKNEYGYQEVLDDIPNANEIVIITYNISDRQNFLIDCITAAQNNAEIKIITNIPNRWEYYYGESFRASAQKKITIYISKLSPEELGGNASVFFNFENHGKIIMTENVAYVGSANFSEESRCNSEFGFIIRDHNFIEFLKSDLLPIIESHSVPYYDYDYTKLLLESNMTLSKIFSLYNELHDQTYSLHDDIDGEWFYYNSSCDYLNMETLELIGKVLESATAIAFEISEAINCIAGDESDDYFESVKLFENIQSISQKTEELLTLKEISDLARFDLVVRVNEILEEEYALEADEENLACCQNLAQNSAFEELYELCEIAKPLIEDLLKTLESYREIYEKIIDCLSSYNLRKVNSDIDNTLQN